MQLRRARTATTVGIIDRLRDMAHRGVDRLSGRRKRTHQAVEVAAVGGTALLAGLWGVILYGGGRLWKRARDN